MKNIKTFEEFVNENNQPVNEASQGGAEQHVKKSMKLDYVNDVTFDEVLVPLAQHMDGYAEQGMGDLEYSKATFELFKKLVDSMAKDHKAGQE